MSWRATYMSHDTNQVVPQPAPEVTTATGVEGCLLYLHLLDTYVFRVYDGVGGFVDYDIKHCDLSVKITDPDAEFYHYSDGRTVLDHSRQTLGVK